MSSVKTLINRAKIPRETHLIAVGEDGSVREAKEGDTDLDEVSAPKDMLPVAIDSPLRTSSLLTLPPPDPDSPPSQGHGALSRLVATGLQKRSVSRTLLSEMRKARGLISYACSQYQVASSAVSAGLSPGATIGAVLLGHFIVSCACAVTGYGALFFPSSSSSALSLILFP